MKWTYFPRNKNIIAEFCELINIFDKNESKISSYDHKLRSDEVLHILNKDLSDNGYVVEKSKRSEDKVRIPVLYGKCGNLR